MRPQNEIGYHAVRTGDNPGEHTIIFGMLDVINMSHGEFYAIGAYAALALGAAGISFWFLLVLVPVLMVPLIEGRLDGLDAFGAAEIELPEYFEAINADFSYQLTAVGAAMPNLHVAREVAGNRFLVAGGVSGKSVSWQVTAVRHDPWTRDRGFETEAEKPAHQKGYYLYPTGYGQDQSKAIGQETRKRAAGVRQ